MALYGDGWLRVQRVKDTCAHAAALRPGDALVAVQGAQLPVPYDGDFQALLARLKAAPRPLELVFRRVLDDAPPAEALEAAHDGFSKAQAALAEVLPAEERPEEHIDAMEAIFAHLSKDQFRRFLRQAESAQDVLTLLDEADAAHAG